MKRLKIGLYNALNKPFGKKSLKLLSKSISVKNLGKNNESINKNKSKKDS